MQKNMASISASAPDDLKPSSFHLGPPEDAFTEFVSYAQSLLSAPCQQDEEDEDEVNDSEQSKNNGNGNGSGKTEEEFQGPPWAWVCSHILTTCRAYSSGVTDAILLSELSQAWQDRYRARSSKEKFNNRIPDNLRQKRNRRRLPNTVTIDSIHNKKFLPLDAVLEAVIVNVSILPGTSSYVLCLADPWSSTTIKHYLHRKFYDLVDPNHGILKQGREVRLSGSRLRISPGSGDLHILPTEYLMVILDEEKDDDCMLLGAQFSSDLFSSVSADAVDRINDYCFYARVERIGNVQAQPEADLHEQGHHVKRQDTLLSDTVGSTLNLVLLDDQILQTHMFRQDSQGSWLALDKPCIMYDSFCHNETMQGICLTYGRATRLYCVPYVSREQQVSVGPSQAFTQLPRQVHMSKGPSLDCTSQSPIISQVLLPCDSHGSLDYSDFPFRLFTVDLRNKMTNVALYGVVSFIGCTNSNSSKTFSMGIQDPTGSINVKLYFNKFWSGGDLYPGHTVFLTGLSCYRNSEGRLECLWQENSGGACIVNISTLLPLLNSPCLHHVITVSELPSRQNGTQVCRVQIRGVELHQLSIQLTHLQCGFPVNTQQKGSFICSFCRYDCGADVCSSFSFTILIQDNTAKVLAYCSGQSAAELLQVFPDEFCSWPEDEQAMYLFTIENEEFMVSLCRYLGDDVSSKTHTLDVDPDLPAWRIVRALKCD